MFYDELYAELGRLFYHIAATDGKVHPSEKKMLDKIVQSNWKPLENSVDRYGTDQANLIEFAFDYEDEAPASEDWFQSFKDFYQENKRNFGPAIIDNILQTSKAIASAYRATNRNEQKVLDRIINMFES